MLRRAVAILVMAVVAAGLFAIDDPHGAAPTVPSPVVGPATGAGGRTATWYCPAGLDASFGDAEHQVVVANPSGAVTARVTGYRDPAGGTPAEVAAAKPSSTTIRIASHSLRSIPVPEVGTGVGGLTVELSGAGAPRASVAHRIVGDTQSDQSNCLTEASTHWYFASADTERLEGTEKDSVGKVWLLNPFAADASVSIAITTDTGTRVPGGEPGQPNTTFRGISVPAGTSRVVDLKLGAKRREQFAVSVTAVGGRVAAELTQTVPGQGLRMTPGVPRLATTWVLADSTGGPDVVENLHILNPSSDAVTVRVSVVPNEDVASFPLPFIVEIPGRRYATVAVSSEGRVNPDTSRWIRVDAESGAGVAVTQVVAIAGPGGDGSAATRPSVAGGLAGSTGSSAVATDWDVTSLDPGPDSQSVVVVANPSKSGIALVDVSRTTGTPSSIAKRLEVPPLGSLAIDLTEAAGTGQIGVRVHSSTPVVVSARTTSNSRAELAMWPAVPSLPGARRLPEG
jgi:hypothetical protein